CSARVPTALPRGLHSEPDAASGGCAGLPHTALLPSMTRCRSPQAPSNVLRKHLRVALVVVPILLLLRERLNRAVLKATFQKPVGRLGGQHEQFPQALLARLALDVFQDHLAAAFLAVVAVRDQAGQFGAAV